MYSHMTDEQAQHLALRHNRATDFTCKMTTQDKVHFCRLRLYSMAKKSLTEEPPEKNSEWKNSCASTLMMTKKQLEDNMVFMLSSLSNKNYELYRVIVAAFEKIKVKGIAAAKVDCKGSNFRGLRGFSETETTEMLQKCANGENVLKSLNSTCFNQKK